MSRILVALLLCLGLGASAHADGRVFPPDNCSTANPFMAFNATPDSNTYCINGQNVMRNAIPVCAADQIVSFNGSAFYCRNSEIELPVCAPGQVLTSNGASISCTTADPSNLRGRSGADGD